MTYSKHLVVLGQQLRKTMTTAEKRLWYDCLRDLPIHFRRQRPYSGYILDFYCASCKLVIEVDGHSHDSADAQMYDQERTTCLEAHGLQVLRFSNDDVLMQLDSVSNQILMVVNTRLNPQPAKSNQSNPIT